MGIGQTGIYFTNEGSKLLGTLFFACQGEARPTAIVMHGIPGIEKHYDLAHAMRDSGINAVIFHYRGCWGSEGDYTMAGLPSDVHAAIDHLSSGLYAEVEPDRFLLLGHSLGGWASIMAGKNERIVGVAALSAVVVPDELPFTIELAAQNFTPWLQGITPEDFVRQWSMLPATLEAVKSLEKPLLVAHGAKDEVIPLEHGQRLYDAAPEPKELRIHPEADHAFLNHRPWFQETVVAWAEGVLAP